MSRRRWLRAFTALILGAASIFLARLMFNVEARAYEASEAEPAPAFTHGRAEDWLNSKPLTWADLKGQVVLLDVWTFECWNCYRSIPWVQSLEKKFGQQGLRVVGVHTPEFEKEKVRTNVEGAARRLGFEYPIMLDNDYSYWNALENQYWPAFYLVDKRGRLRARFIGETHAGDANAQRAEAAIAQLLKE